MTSHETALEAAWEVAKPLGIRNKRSHKERFVAGLSAYISTLSPDVSGLVEMRENWALGSKGPIILSEAADAIASLSLQLAAVEAARKFITIPTTVDEAEMMQKLGFSWLEANAPERLTDLAKSLSAAQEENERLRALLVLIGANFKGMEDGNGDEAPELVLIREITSKGKDKTDGPV